MRGSVLSVPLIASLQRVWGTFETERRGWDIDILARRQKMRRKFQQKLRHIIVTDRKPACICTDPPLRRYISTARLDIVCICTSSLAGIEPACVITSLALPPLLFFAFPYRRPRVYSSRPWYSLFSAESSKSIWSIYVKLGFLRFWVTSWDLSRSLGGRRGTIFSFRVVKSNRAFWPLSCAVSSTRSGGRWQFVSSSAIFVLPPLPIWHSRLIYSG